MRTGSALPTIRAAMLPPLENPLQRPAPSRQAGGALLVLAIVAVVFARALLGRFVYDDVTLIAQNPGLHDPLDFTALWTQPLWGAQLGHWRPLTAQLLALCWWLGGGGPWAIHALALLLHLAATLGVLALLRELGAGAWTAALAALLFALHPAQVESVAWCSALNDVLVGACTPFALRSWLQWRRTGRRSAQVAALALAAAALLSKEAGVLVPVLFAAADAATGRLRQGLRAHVLPALLLVSYWLLRAAVFGEAAAGFGRATFVPLNGGPLRALTVAAGLLSGLAAPLGRDLFVGAEQVTVLDAVVAVAVAAAVAWRVLRGGPIGRLGALCIAAAVLLPALTNGSLGPYPIAQRYLYVACAGAAALLAGPPPWRMCCCALLAAAMAPVTLLRIGDFADEPTLVERALQRHPDDPRLHYMRGAIALQQSGLGDAAAQSRARAAARQALLAARDRLGTEPAGRDPFARLRADVGTGLAWCTLLEEASNPRPDWSRAELQFLKVTLRWAESADAYVGLGIARAQDGRLTVAEQAFRQAIALDPATGKAHFNLGRLLLLRGDRDGARAQLLQALRLQPEDPAVHELLQQLDRDEPRGGARGR